MFCGFQWCVLFLHTLVAITFSEAIPFESFVFTHDSNFDRKSTTQMLYRLSTLETIPSSLDCARQCLADEICRGYFHNSGKRSCTLLYNLLSSPTEADITEDGWKLFVMKDLHVTTMPPANYIYNHELKFGYKPYYDGGERRTWLDAKQNCDGRTNERLIVMDTDQKYRSVMDVLNIRIPSFQNCHDDLVTDVCKNKEVTGRGGCCRLKCLGDNTEVTIQRQFIHKVFKGMEMYFVGGEKVAGGWKWITSDPATITWASGEPNGSGDYLALERSASDVFNAVDDDGLMLKGFICEYTVV